MDGVRVVSIELRSLTQHSQQITENTENTESVCNECAPETCEGVYFAFP